MSEFNFEKATKVVLKGLVILAVVTFVEVLISLFGKPLIGKGAALIIIILSMYKAYFIVMSFMHMGHA